MDTDTTGGTTNNAHGITIEENTTGPIGSPVTATDADELFYELRTIASPTDAFSAGTASTLFEIDSGSGQISVKSGVVLNDDGDTTITDGNNAASYLLIVQATDPSTSTDTVVVQVSIDGINEAPAFTEAAEAATQKTLYIDEDGSDEDTTPDSGLDTDKDTTGDQAPVAYTAADPDGAGVTLTYEVLDDKGKTSTVFELDGSQVLGVISTATLDYETTNKYVIDIVAKDPDGLSDKVTVTVNVRNVNENGSVTISARQPQVDRPVTAEISDPDGGISGIQLRWVATGDLNTTDCTGATFTDVEPTGSHTPTAAEATAGNKLCVQATYSDNATGEDETTTATGITDAVVENKPTSNAVPKFTDEEKPDGADPVAIEIEENTTGNIGDSTKTTAADADDPTDPLIYEIGGPDAGMFAIADRTMGQISVASGVTLNYESPADVGGTAGDNAYVVMVTATDPSGASDTVMVTITVTNVDEAPELSEAPAVNVPPAFDSATADFMVYENMGRGHDGRHGNG